MSYRSTIFWLFFNDWTFRHFHVALKVVISNTVHKSLTASLCLFSQDRALGVELLG